MSQGLIPQDLIERIKERADIAEVVSGYVTLARAGQNFKGLCPFHAEKTPSFTVSPSRQLFHCFGCGVGGNVFTFLMKMEGFGFPDAVRELGKRSGIPVPDFLDAGAGPEAKTRERLWQVNDAATALFHRHLLDRDTGRAAWTYLTERGILPETIESFRIGLALPAWDDLIRNLAKEGFTVPELFSAGLIVPKDPSARPSPTTSGYYDRFRARVMLPIRDLRGRVVGFGGRVLDDALPKYLNSPETPLFSKGRALFALDQARGEAGRTNSLVIVEGYFDAIALHQAGLRNVVATLGTALTPDHVTTIRRFVSKVVLLFDPDPAGVRAALRTLDLFKDSEIGVRVVSLPGGEDPDTFVRKQGAEAFLRLQEHAPSLLDFAVEQSLLTAASGRIEDRIRSVDEILRILQTTNHRIEKEECTRRVAERLGISQQRLIERYPELVLKEARLKGNRTADRKGDAPAQKGPFQGSPEERDLAHLLLHGLLSADHLRALNVGDFTVPACRRIVEIGLEHVDQSGRVQLRPVLDRVVADSACGPLATELAMWERHYDDAAQYAKECLDRLNRKRRELVLAELIAKLRRAEQEGRTEDAQQLNAQVNELRVEKAGAPTVR